MVGRGGGGFGGSMSQIRLEKTVNINVISILFFVQKFVIDKEVKVSNLLGRSLTSKILPLKISDDISSKFELWAININVEIQIIVKGI